MQFLLYHLVVVVLPLLPTILAVTTSPQSATALAAIRQTLNIYPLAIDSKDFAVLSAVFSSDAVANYSAPLDVISGLSAIQAALNASLLPVTTQHALSTMVIRITNEDKAGMAMSASSITYYTATHFGHGAYDGQILSAWGRYEDALVLEDDVWRIKKRQLVYMGPLVGNLSMFNNAPATVAEPSLPGFQVLPVHNDQGHSAFTLL